MTSSVDNTALQRKNEELLARIDELEQVIAQAYVVVGSLLIDANRFDTDAGECILDNLAEMKIIHDVLPWSSQLKND